MLHHFRELVPALRHLLCPDSRQGDSEVGGLRDTVEPYNPVTGSGTGFSFGNFSGYWMVQTLEKALDVYENHAEAWKQLQHNAMTRDFSWDTASLAYVDLYKQLV